MVRFAHEEPLFCDISAVISGAGRVTPGPEPGRVRVFFMMAYTSDYGRCTVARHRGDLERVVLDFAVEGEVARLVRAYTAAHEYTAFDGGRSFGGDSLAELEYRPSPVSGEPRWVIYASGGKHASYASRAACSSHSQLLCSREDCRPPPGGYREVLFPSENAGEPLAPMVWDESSRLFPWSTEPYCPPLRFSREDNTPCGPGKPVDKLLRDPFQPGQPPLPTTPWRASMPAAW